MCGDGGWINYVKIHLKYQVFLWVYKQGQFVEMYAAHCEEKKSQFYTQFFSSLSNLQYNWAATWDLEKCGMCDQQSLRSACAYVQSDQSLCKSLEYPMSVKLLTDSKLKRRLQRLIRVYAKSCQNVKLLAITCCGSYVCNKGCWLCEKLIVSPEWGGTIIVWLHLNKTKICFFCCCGFQFQDKRLRKWINYNNRVQEKYRNLSKSWRISLYLVR